VSPEAIDWRLKKVFATLNQFVDPMLNLHHFNPYLKKQSAVFNYRILF